MSYEIACLVGSDKIAKLTTLFPKPGLMFLFAFVLSVLLTKWSTQRIYITALGLHIIILVPNVQYYNIFENALLGL